ncbi:MAG: hypothetical protein O7D96_05240 [SAR324 cluster bacterium]|nr:hypothetical protein [SAR324 cluster bacterium]
MDSPVKDIERIDRLMAEAAETMEGQRWDEAQTALEQVRAIDPLQPKTYDLLADVCDGLNDPGQAGRHRSRAKAIRQEQWQRQVEADVRGGHEILGDPSRD